MRRPWIAPLVFALSMMLAHQAQACPTAVSGIATPNSTVCAESSTGILYCNTADATGNFAIGGGAVPPSTGGCLPTSGTFFFYQLNCHDDGMSVNRNVSSERYGGSWLDVTCKPKPVHKPQICLLGTDWDWAVGHVTKLWDVNTSTGAVFNPRSTGLGHLIGIAMHPSNTRLYAVTSVGGSPSVNSLYKIDATTGASTFIGSLGLGTLFEGDLAFSDSGTLYGIQGTKLYTIDTNTGAATVVGNPNGSDYSFLSFNGSGTLYGIDNGMTPGFLPTYLDQINPATAAVITSQSLSPYLGGYGGMDWNQIGGYMWVADGQDPGSTYAGNRKLFRLDPVTGTLTAVGPLGLSHGLTGLAACKPCAVETALDADASEPAGNLSHAEVLQMAYRVRDELLRQTRVGKHYIDRFYDHSLRMAYLMVSDRSLRIEAADFLHAMAPGFFDLLDEGGRSEKVSQQMIDSARHLASRLAEADQDGGGALARAIDVELQRVDLDRLRGLTFADAWAYLNTLPTDAASQR